MAVRRGARRRRHRQRHRGGSTLRTAAERIALRSAAHMARSYAQIAAIVFLIAGIGGFFTREAGTGTDRRGGGNFHSVTPHMTYLRRALAIVLGAAVSYAATAGPPWG